MSDLIIMLRGILVSGCASFECTILKMRKVFTVQVIWLEIGKNSGIVETFFVGREAISAAYFVHKSVRPSSYMTTIIVFGSTFYFIISPEKCINVLLCVENARNVHYLAENGMKTTMSLAGRGMGMINNLLSG